MFPAASGADIRPVSRTVVVADDVAALRQLMRIMLQDDAEFEVIGEASNGREAVDVVCDLHPDLLLLDLSMPQMDGLEVISQLAATCRETAIVVFSGFSASRAADIAVSLGARAYIEKGATQAEVLRVARSVCGLSPSAT
jgi:DNA-binding NarL/FixJ family response regulator